MVLLLIRGGNLSNEPELLCDLTTTEYAFDAVWTQGDNGQVFDDYREIYIKMLLQPTDKSERRFRVSFSTAASTWGGNYFVEYPQSASYPASTEIGCLIFAHFYKSVFGIDYERRISYNNTSVNKCMQSPNNAIDIEKFPDTPDKLQDTNFPQHFECIKIGSYVANMPPNCRFMIYGIK